MKIVFLAQCFPPSISGGSLYTYELAKGLAAKGYNVTVIARKFFEDSSSFDAKQNFKIKRLFRASKSPKMTILSGIISLLGILIKYRPALIFIPDVEAHMPCAIVRLLIPFKYTSIMHCEEPFFFSKGIKKSLFSFYARKADRIFTPSNYTKYQIAKHANITLSKITVAYPGIDIKKFQKPGNIVGLKNKMGLKQEKIILTLARLVEFKGQGDVIQSLPLVIQKIPNLKYIIAGRGPDYERLKKLTIDLKLTDRVIFTGFVDNGNINDYYELCDLFIMPSNMEGLAICFLEASAKGKPVIGGNCCGIPEAIIDGETGLLVEPRNHKQISEAIIKLLENNGLAKTMGEKGRQRIISKFSWTNTIETIYQHLGLNNKHNY